MLSQIAVPAVSYEDVGGVGVSIHEIERAAYWPRSSKRDGLWSLPWALSHSVRLVIFNASRYSWDMSTLQEIEAAILGLSEQDRLRLADKILRSLPKPPGAMVSEEILAEAIRRDQELESGVLEPLTEEAFWAGVRRGGA